MRIIYFRADANNEIGYGHFIRSLALADILKDDFKCVFFVSNPTDEQVSLVRECCECVALDGAEHFEIFLSFLKGKEIVVLDNYFFNTEYQNRIREKGAKLVCIDDIHDKHYVADAVINQSLNARKEDFSCEAYTRLCLGSQYLLVRKPFRTAMHKDISLNNNPFREVFVCFGGTDEYDLTYKVCKLLDESRKFKKIHAVIGPEYNGDLSLLSRSKIQIYKNINAEQMVKIIISSDLAIVPCSSVLLEVCCIRKPLITGYYVKNQINLNNMVKSLLLGISCDNLLERIDEELIKSIDKAFINKNLIIKKQEALFQDNSSSFLELFKELSNEQ